MLRVSLFSHIFGSTRILPVCYREKEKTCKSHCSSQTRCSARSYSEGRGDVKIPNIKSEILIPVEIKTWFSGCDILVVFAKD